MQKAYIDSLYQIAQKDKNVLSVVADNGTDYDWLFQRDLPDQFLNVGIAEQNMIAIASGMADCGYIPFISSGGAFLIYRGYEFIRDDLCIGSRNVKIFATGSGMSIGNLGPTHHATEDIALLRTLPRLTIFTPSTPWEVGEAVEAAYRINGPVYIRAGMNGEVNLKLVEHNSAIIHTYRFGNQVAILVSGSIVQEAITAANKLNEIGIDAGVFSISSLSELTYENIAPIIENKQLLVTVEDHCKTGGLGGLMAELISERQSHPPLLRIGLDGFAIGYGTQQCLRCINQLSAEAIAEKILKRIQIEI